MIYADKVKKFSARLLFGTVFWFWTFCSKSVIISAGYVDGLRGRRSQSLFRKRQSALGVFFSKPRLAEKYRGKA